VSVEFANVMIRSSIQQVRRMRRGSVLITDYGVIINDQGGHARLAIPWRSVHGYKVGDDYVPKAQVITPTRLANFVLWLLPIGNSSLADDSSEYVQDSQVYGVLTFVTGAGTVEIRSKKLCAGEIEATAEEYLRPLPLA